MKTIAVMILLLATPAWAIKASIANIAAATTIAVNADQIVKAVRHPKKTAKETGTKIKKAVTGK